MQTLNEHNATMTAYVKIYVEATERGFEHKRESVALFAGIKSNDFPDFRKNE